MLSINVSHRMHCYLGACFFIGNQGNDCRDGANCQRFGCYFEHPPSRPVIAKVDCREGEFCQRYGCHFEHPPSRPDDCPDGTSCKLRACSKIHPGCMYGIKCVKFGCKFKHPPGRPVDCPAGTECTTTTTCLRLHPGAMVRSCHYNADCVQVRSECMVQTPLMCTHV